MRHFGMLLGAILLFAFGAAAQINSENVQLMSSPFAGSSFDMLFDPLDAAGASRSASSTASGAPGPAAVSFAEAESWSPESVDVGDPPPQESVSGVRVLYYTQISGGYTFFHFREGFGTSQNLNGFNISMQQYFPNRPHLGLDGEYFAALGSLGPGTGCVSDCRKVLQFGGGGLRYRRAEPRGIQVFARGLLGYSHFVPRTIFGGEGAFAYELGVGADLIGLNRRWGLRLQADMLGTRYFGQNQFSPKLSVGVVYNF
ncbi:MAG: hypothetical protein ACRD4S_06420 [Candidatus Acidiferrales bacterium]